MGATNRWISTFPYPPPAGPPFFGSAPKERGERKPRPSSAGRLSSREDRTVDARGSGSPASPCVEDGATLLVPDAGGCSVGVWRLAGMGHWLLRWRSRERPSGGLPGVRWPASDGGWHGLRRLRLTRELPAAPPPRDSPLYWPPRVSGAEAPGSSGSLGGWRCSRPFDHRYLRGSRRSGSAHSPTGHRGTVLPPSQIPPEAYRLSLMLSGFPDSNDLWMASRMAVLLRPSRSLTIVSAPVRHAWTKERIEEGMAPTHWSKTL